METQTPPRPAVFDGLKQYTKNGVEFWTARSLQQLLGYDTWQNFENAIGKAIIACDGAGISSKVHFSETTKIREKGKGVMGKDYFLTRHACYLVAMNSDATKPEVADAMTYFSIQTQRQEISDQQLKDAERVEWRGRLKDRQKKLCSVAKVAGVHNYALFNDAGYKGLYGMHRTELLEHKKLPPSAQLFDHVGTTELAANAFRATQAAEILHRDKIQGQDAASDTHERVGGEVRKTIKGLGNTMPENLPTEPDIKIIERRLAKTPKRLQNAEPPCQPPNQPE